MGSVKDLKVIREPSQNSTGSGQFIFTDAYSAFDWGKMPDFIAGKGASLCMISAFFFEKLEEAGIKTHYGGLVAKNGTIVRFSDLHEPTNVMQIKLYSVPGVTFNGDKYSYAKYKNLKGNFVVPIEVIYRNSLPEGSSVFKRLKNGLITPKDLGLTTEPVPGQKLANSIIDLSTKLEAYDRYWKESEIYEHGIVTEDELGKIKDATLKINDVISKVLDSKGFSNEDGKVEFSFDEKRSPVLIDTVATPDENRFTYKGVQFSKEVIRKHYRKTEWFKKTEEAKQKNPTDWKKLIGQPPLMPAGFKNEVATMYQILCNEITGRKFFNTTSKLDDLITTLG